MTQFIILDAIGRAGEVAHCDLARLFAASEQTFSRRLGSARRAGWVTMQQDARRRRIYRLTPAGRKVLEIATPYWERAQDRMRRELGESDWKALGDFTERITEAALRAESARKRNCRPVVAA